MATAVLLPPSARDHSYPQSILQHHRHSQFALLTMAASRPSNRRIRFAPLPDPRRSVLITDDGNELPFPQAAFATHFSASPTPSPTPDSRVDYFSTVDNASLSSSSSESKRNSDLLDPSSSGTATPVSITTTTPSEYDASVPPSPLSTQCPSSPLTAVSNRLSEHAASNPSSSKSRSLTSMFRLKRNSNCSSPSSSTTITPIASIDRSATPTSFSRRNFSAEEILTLGTINLFRAASSKDGNDCEAGSSSGWSLTRWTSASSSNSHRHPKDLTWGHPLTRASSTQSYQSKSKAAKEAKANRPRIPNRKGTRLLNGRYYGVKPRVQNVNPFANVRDDEPEFVEWGYGGMGSVKGATSAGAHGHWRRLHGTAVGGAPVSQKVVSDEEDDGSGMAWIKKRREQREKEKKDKEEKERLESEALEKAESVDTVPETPLPSATQTLTYLSPQSALEVPRSRDRTPSRPGTANSARTALSASSSVTVTPNQVPTPKPSMPTLTIPLPPPTLIVTPSTSSAPLSPATAVPPAMTPGGTRAINIPAPAHHYHRHSRAGFKDLSMVDSFTPPSSSGLPHEKRNSASEDESESDNENETESDDEYEEDEESDEEQRTRERKTALGAGVEKISRHH